MCMCVGMGGVHCMEGTFFATLRRSAQPTGVCFVCARLPSDTKNICFYIASTYGLILAPWPSYCYFLRCGIPRAVRTAQLHQAAGKQRVKRILVAL